MFWLVIVILILIGLAFLLLEILVIPGTGIAGIIGFIILGIGVWQGYVYYGTIAGHWVLAGTIGATVAVHANDVDGEFLRALGRGVCSSHNLTVKVPLHWKVKRAPEIPARSVSEPEAGGVRRARARSRRRPARGSKSPGTAWGLSKHRGPSSPRLPRARP